VRLQDAVERSAGRLLEVDQGSPHIIGRRRDRSRIQNGAFEIGQACEAEGLNGAQNGRV